MGNCTKPLICGYVSLNVEADRPACDFFTAKEKDAAPVCSNCIYWIE